MLNIVDINTNENTLAEVTRLKEEFQIMMPNVSNGNVIIISNFPPVGNMVGPLDYLIIISVFNETGNYLSHKINGKQKYIHSAVILIKSINDNNILLAEEEYLQTEDGQLNFEEALQNMRYDFIDYCKQYEDIKPFAIYKINSSPAKPTYRQNLILNYPLTAKFIIWGIASQSEALHPNYGVYSFIKGSQYTLTSEIMLVFARKLITETDKRTEYGILTKKKLDRISKSGKKDEKIYENVGKTLSLISGKAGTGKTLALTRIIHKHSQNHHAVRFLTFNKLLVFDLIQTLRNFPNYSDLQLSAQTVHQFFFKQARDLGITLLLGESRVKELLDLCEERIESLHSTYLSYVSANPSGFNKTEFLSQVTSSASSDNQEYILFANFIKKEGMGDFAELKQKYLAQKKKYLEPNVGSKLFIEDYGKVLERIYQAITDTEGFYKDLDIRNRRELLFALYKMDAKTDNDIESIIPLEQLEKRIKSVKGSAKWSRLFLIDECQDFHILEKEILFNLRGGNNMVVATGGKEQLIRRSSLLDWTVSMGHKIPHIPFKLNDISFRQKQNIIGFVNAFGKEFGLPINLQSVNEEQGLGKVVIDIRTKTGFINTEIASELKINGELNGCSPYESVIYLIPSRNYTDKILESSMVVDDTDVVHNTNQSTGRRTKNLEELTALGYFCWDGVTEDKGKLKVPQQTDTRILHYESCRGLEAWSCALLSLDDFFSFKRRSEEAALHLADDLHLSEEMRRDKYAALWCLMAFTRPIDTLYIHLDSIGSPISELLLKIANEVPGVIVLK